MKAYLVQRIFGANSRITEEKLFRIGLDRQGNVILDGSYPGLSWEMEKRLQGQEPIALVRGYRPGVGNFCNKGYQIYEAPNMAEVLRIRRERVQLIKTDPVGVLRRGTLPEIPLVAGARAVYLHDGAVWSIRYSPNR